MIEALHDTPSTLQLEPREGVQSTTATCVVYRADGTVLQTLTVAKPTATTTTQAGTTALVLVVADASSFAVGERVGIVNDGVTYTPKIVRLDGLNVTLAASLPVVPDLGATVLKVRLTATLSAPGIANLGDNYRVEWRYSDGSRSGYHTESLSVVRWPFQCPITAQDVAEHLATVHDATRSALFCSTVAGRVEDKLQAQLHATGRRAYLFPDPSSLREPAQLALVWVLAESGFVPGGEDAASLIKSLRYQFVDTITATARGLVGFDADASGTIEETEAKASWGVIRISR